MATKDGDHDASASAPQPEAPPTDPGAQPQLAATEDVPARTTAAGAFLLALLVWLVIGVYVVISYTFTSQARILPQVVAYPTWGFATIVLAFEAARWRRSRQGGRDVSTTTDASPKPAAERPYRSELNALAWLAIFVAGVFAIGFIPAAAIFAVAYLRRYGHETWLLSIAYGIILGVVIHVVFVVVLGARVFPGRLLQLL